jgi:tetratricopeptide (TPR) repeat protein/predicted Ser/Thr protein kinase
MEPERWATIESLYHAALEHEPRERSRWLQQACDDAGLRAEVESLLACADVSLSNPGARSGMAKLWDRIAGDSNSDAMIIDAGIASTGDAAALPSVIGRYRILRLLGEGGMGVVYEAEQEQPRRRVALKVIKSGLGDAKMVRRFHQELAALGRLQHPGIAQIYEAGTAENGFGTQPYFAMEFIRGQPLLEYADQHQLSTRARLDLIARICDAVHHAHQRGIIHRDLKPFNILVDETGQPKILDFGVARATDSDARATHQTDLGQLVGTLAYMSPEQVLADPLEVDTRTDIYALGVVLYQALTRRLPYKISPKLHEAVRTIQEDEPAPLGTVSSEYRGDIETIVGKALEKDKTRRYSSAAELAADIRRHLQDEPIMARPASAIYQLNKLARRHKALVWGVAAVFIVLVAGVILSAREAARANSEAAISRAISDFLQNDLLAQASAANQSQPNTKPDPDLKVRTALDRAAARIPEKFNRQPEVEAAIRDTIGQTYLDLGLYPQARTQLERALDLRRRKLGARNPATLQTTSRIGYAAVLQGKYSEAEALLTRTLEIQRRLLGPDHPDTLSSLNSLAANYERQGKYPQAASLESQTLEIRRRVLGPEHPDTLKSMNNLANVYSHQGEFEQAELLHSGALTIKRRALGPEHPSTLMSMHNLANVYRLRHKYTEAEAMHREALEIQRRVLGPEHPDTQMSVNDLANDYWAQGEYAQAEPLYKQAWEMKSRVLGPEHPDTLKSMNNVANSYWARGEYAQAETLYSHNLEIRRRMLGPEHPDTLRSMNNLAGSYADRGDYKHAEALFLKCLEIQRRVMGPWHPDVLGTIASVASMYQRKGNYALASTYAAESLAGRRRNSGAENTDTMVSAEDLALAYQSQGKFAEAESLAREALEFYRKEQPGDWQQFRAESLLGASLAGQKKYAEAEPLLLEGFQGMAARKHRIVVPDWHHVDLGGKWLVQLYEDWGKTDKAGEWKRQLQVSTVASYED